jgi:HPr kinase/phosphorylase
MIDKLTPEYCFSHLKEQIDLNWLAGKQNADREIKQNLNLAEQATIIGHLNLINHNHIQVIGEAEKVYLDKVDIENDLQIKNALFSNHIAAIIFSDNIECPKKFIELADANETPLLASRLSSGELIDATRYYLSNLLAESTTLHGVFMEVLGTGVLITGESSIGKSELALELITRNHRLIADDAAVFTRIAPHTLNGTCPAMLKDFMEVRGLGVLNIRAMYGENAIKQNKHLRLIIHMKQMNSKSQQQLDRLYGERTIRSILDVDIPQIMLPVASGRNLAVMVEAAVRNHILLEHGHNTSEEFIKRQSQFLKQ